jgi:hypothetical protein
MKKILTLSLIALTTMMAAQKKTVDPKYQYVYKDVSFETDDYKIYIEDAVNVDTKAKFKIRVFNKTNDYLIFRPANLIFHIGASNLPGTDKQMIIMPNDEDWKVIDVKGSGLQEEKYTVEISSVLKVPAGVAPIKVEDFNIPVSKNDFTAGAFKCNVKKAEAKTDKSSVKFECIYQGDGIGILAPSKVSAIMPKGQENANSSRNKGTLLERGKSDDFTVEIKELQGSGDMQKEPFKLKWNDAFRDAKINPIKGGTITIELDPTKTAEKNK